MTSCSFHFFLSGPYLAQLGCELLRDKTLVTSLTCFVGTSSKDKCASPLSCRTKTNVREFGDQEESLPSTSTVTVPPPAGTTQISKFPVCAVNAIHRPSGDQSGSEGLETPSVRMV